jgi:PKD repeat protein
LAPTRRRDPASANPRRGPLLTKLVALTPILLLSLLAGGGRAWAQGLPITFSIIADVPYSSSEVNDLADHVDDHNLYSPSYFLVHLGDILAGSEECVESRYEDVAAILQMLAVPAFIIPGDNEWNDCSDPDEAWTFWEANFTDFESNFCGTPPVQEQAVRHENFAFTHSGVLFVGLNLVGGAINNQSEWNERLQQDADWVIQHLEDEEPNVRAAVVFGHAGPSAKQDLFFDQFVPAAGTFGKPVLYAHGDDHSWKVDNPFSENNMLRVQLDRGDSSNPPVHVTVTLEVDPPDAFLLERDPWPSGTDPFNVAPCVDVGPDVAIDPTDTLQLDALVTDDGVPTSTNSLILDWSKVSGPGTVSFGDASAASTTATFSVPGTYELRLTADDADLVGADEMNVQVGSGQALITIDDVSVVEGDSGTVAAIFTVSLLSSSGGQVTVDYDTANGSASAGSDYQSASGQLTFSGSDTTETVQVSVNGDQTVESDETFFVQLSNPSNATLLRQSGVGTILNDDAAAPVADFTVTPTDGAAPLTVAFSDLSSGGPTAWSWNFGDGGTSNGQNPTHTYAEPGLYTVSLTVGNAVGSDTETKVDYVSVTPAPPQVTLTPTDDARVRSSSPGSNYGSDVVLRAKLDPSGSTHHSYLKFDASGIGGAVQSATLRLFVVDGSSDGGSIRLVSNDLLGTSTPWRARRGRSRRRRRLGRVRRDGRDQRSRHLQLRARQPVDE